MSLRASGRATRTALPETTGIASVQSQYALRATFQAVEWKNRCDCASAEPHDAFRARIACRVDRSDR